MKHDTLHYDREALRNLLADTIPEPLSAEMAEHLAQCADCRREYESLAARPEWWSQTCSDAKQILSNPDAYQSHGDCAPNLAALSSDADDAFVTDFAVDFLDPSENPALLGRLGEYEILEIIGHGGMGIVLKGHQPELNRFVAVKVLSPHLALSAAARKRFAREAQATAAVVHPHVMAIHAVAAQARLPYLVMPFVACESLQQRLDRQGPLDLKDILRIGLQAAHGLAAAHAQGLVHRDIKPANILLETSVDRVMLTDFGLARAVDDATLTRTGIIAGTPQYMSPEQANGEPIDPRSDLFSLGSVLYAMCTGRPPFRAETTFGVLRRIRETPPRSLCEINVDIPVWFEQVVFQLLSKAADQRPASAAEVASCLEQCLAHLQQPATNLLPPAISSWAAASVPEVNVTAEVPRAKNNHAKAILGIVAILITLGIAYQFASSGFHGRAVHSDPNAQTSVEPATHDSLLQWNHLNTDFDETTSLIKKLETESQHQINKLSAASPSSSTIESSDHKETP